MSALGDTHAHVIDPPLTFGGLRVGQTHCARCHRPLSALLESQATVVIVRSEPVEWTAWQTPSTEELPRG